MRRELCVLEQDGGLGLLQGLLAHCARVDELIDEDLQLWASFWVHRWWQTFFF